MPTYAAFLRGVSPLNAKMPELQKCFESAGFENVKTVLGRQLNLLSRDAER